jgi:hypothetical protein
MCVCVCVCVCVCSTASVPPILLTPPLVTVSHTHNTHEYTCIKRRNEEA